MVFKTLKIIVSLWKFISYPLLGERCRFYPSCSEYLLEAVHKYGFIKGGALGTKRLCRCHPFNKNSGTDPVP